ncbi:MAG: CHAT domain-containing protein [Prevotellaceae bacterium]|jgi:tetratricopeptide (TPR) repeat protein|nr:CHAT domain-containing protein [Prevotellaceae bacterium]
MTFSAQTAKEATRLHDLGREYLSEGKIAEGREYTTRAMNMRRELFGEVNEDYINSLNNYANSFEEEKNYAKAIELYRQVLTLCEKLKNPHPNLGMYTLNMGRSCYLNGNTQEAAKYCEQALPLVEKYGGMYEKLLTILTLVYTDLEDNGNYQRIMALTEEHNCHELTKECNEPQCMWERAQYYMYKGNTAKAKEYFLKVLSMPMENEMKMEVHKTYARFNYSVKDYISAVEYQLSAANIRKELDGNKETKDYADLLYTAASLYSYIGKAYLSSIEILQKVIGFYIQDNSPTAQKKLAECRVEMGDIYSALEEYGKAKECYQQVISYYESTDKNDAGYPKAILSMAKAEKSNEEYDASIEHHLQAMKLFEARDMYEEYADAANSLELCSFYAGKYTKVDLKDDRAKISRRNKLNQIIKETLDNLQITMTYFSKLTYAQSLATLAGSYKLNEDYVNAIAYYKQYVEALRDGIRDEFRMQGEAERMMIWTGEVADNVQMLRELLVTFPVDDDTLRGELAALVYDVELLSKGVLLNSAIEFEKVLAAQNDKELNAVYDQLKKNEAEINRLRQNAVQTDLEKILPLTQENQALQLKLYKGCAEFADFTNYMSYDWKDVRQAMKETDVVIEFAAIEEALFDNENYIVALILTPDIPFPVAVPICNMEEAREMESNDQLFELQGNPVWGLLSQYLVGKQRIFFSPDGSFNSIGIEYLLYNGKPLSDQFEVYRLSSTKELCYRHQKERPTKVVLFGDINYNDVAQTATSTKPLWTDQRGAGGIDVFANLSNTLREVNDIQAILKRSKVKSIVQFTDVEADRDAFKNLTGSNVNILHIATHGMYRDVKGSTDAESMKNSLLVFAGANIGDNGLVSASEIAGMNLRQCDLAVLSACETGLGKFGEDGVFGLQRGFKNAGVHTLMMSLKKVYDDSTADLMISFYKHFINGATKRKALMKAQQEIRDNGYKDAKYWATFILLDAY